MQKGKLEHVKRSKIRDDEYLMRSNKDDEAFIDLVSSIKRVGILVPLLLSKNGDGFSVVAGHRRFRAAVAANLSDVPAYVFEGKEGPGWEAAIAENMFRQDLSAVEEAAAIEDCLTSGVYDEVQLANVMGRSVSWIRDRREIVNWPDDITFAIHSGRISVGAARNLCQIGDDAHRSLLVAYAVDNGATARTTAAWLQAFRASIPIADPGDVEPGEGRSALPPIVPYTPCVVCGDKKEMGKLSYMPVCPGCSEIVATVAREVRQGGGCGD